MAGAGAGAAEGALAWPSAGPSAPGARWASASRSWARPRWMRERTVPSLMPRVVGDLLVGQALDVAEHDGGAEVRRQGVERALRRRRRSGRRRRPASGAGAAAGQPGRRRSSDERVEADPLLAAHLVEEEVGGDPVQPALEGAGRVGVQRPEHPDEDLLGEVLGVVRRCRSGGRRAGRRARSAARRSPPRSGAPRAARPGQPGQARRSGRSRSRDSPPWGARCAGRARGLTTLHCRWFLNNLNIPCMPGAAGAPSACSRPHPVFARRGPADGCPAGGPHGSRVGAMTSQKPASWAYAEEFVAEDDGRRAGPPPR